MYFIVCAAFVRIKLMMMMIIIIIIIINSSIFCTLVAVSETLLKRNPPVLNWRCH